MVKRKNKYALTGFLKLFKDAFTELLRNDPLRMAGATAFFTTFALPPILVILIQLLGLVLNPVKIRRELFHRLAGIIGNETVQQIVGVLSSFRELAKNWYVTVGGFLFLVFVATTLFKVIKSSLNQLWKIKLVRKKNIWVNLRSRLQSVLVILVAGVLFGIGLLAEGLQTFLGKYIFEFSPLLSFYFNSILNHFISIFIVMLWFAIVFHYLPDGRPPWKITLAGALLTSLLFTIGKYLLHWLLTYSNINTIYGTSASIVLLLLFVFYSSLILYYGAAFTKVWGDYRNKPVKPLEHAVHFQVTIDGKEEEKS